MVDSNDANEEIIDLTQDEDGQNCWSKAEVKTQYEIPYSPHTFYLNRLHNEKVNNSCSKFDIKKLINDCCANGTLKE